MFTYVGTGAMSFHVILGIDVKHLLVRNLGLEVQDNEG